MRTALGFVLVFIFSTHAFANIETFANNPILIRPFTSGFLPSMGLETSAAPAGASNSVEYTQLTNPQYGVAVSYLNIFSLSYVVTPEFSLDTGSQKTFSEFWHFSTNFRKFHLEAYGARAQGIFIKNTFNLITNIPNDAFFLEPSIYFGTKGANLYYMVNYENFSFSSAFDQTERQDTSGGSIILGASATQQVISGSPMIPTQYQANFGQDATFKSGEFYTVSGMAGLGLTAVANKAWFASGIVMYGLGVRTSIFKTDLQETNSSGTISNMQWRASTGYNGENFIFSIAYYRDESRFQVSTLNVRYSVEGSEIASGIRF